jgi:flotillin
VDGISNTFSIFLLIPIIIVLVIAVMVFFKLRYRIAKSNQALVISGSKKRDAGPTVLVAGGAFVSPLRRFEYFNLDVMTVTSTDRETQTKTVVPVVVTWTAQLKPDTETAGALEKAVMGFIGKKPEDIEKSLQQTLEGEVRAVVATLTPEEVIEGRDKFKSDVETNVKERMSELGFKLISLNITEVRDNQGHYDHLAAKDREEKRRIAENLKATEEQSIAETAAKTGQASEFARIAKELAVAEQERGLALKKSEYQAETDKAAKDAEFAGRIREQDRRKEFETSEGAANVERELQNQKAAEARRNVVTTDAETAKQKLKIETEAAVEKARIETEAAAAIAQERAAGEAAAAKERALGEAEAKKTEAEAEAERIRKTGEAAAGVKQLEGEAEAAAILAKGKAEAEAERLKAEALAANDKVNLEVALAEIRRDTTITVMTEVGKAMAHIGENGTFIDMGGNTGEGGDLLTRVMGNIPEMLKKLDIKNEALNGRPFVDSLNGLVTSITNQKPEKTAPAASEDEVTKPGEPAADDAVDSDFAVADAADVADVADASVADAVADIAVADAVETDVVDTDVAVADVVAESAVADSANVADVADAAVAAELPVQEEPVAKSSPVPEKVAKDKPPVPEDLDVDEVIDIASTLVKKAAKKRAKR